jgi:hypothetical protein
MNEEVKGDFFNSDFLESYRYLLGVDVLIIDFKDGTRKSFNVHKSLFNDFRNAKHHDEFYTSEIEPLVSTD